MNMQDTGLSSQECLDKLGFSSDCLNNNFSFASGSKNLAGASQTGLNYKRSAYEAEFDNDSNDLSIDDDTDQESKSGVKRGPPNGKKTKGRVKIKMEFIDNKLRRYTTFSKRKTGIMKKAYELSTLTGTQVMLLVASETGHVYTFATRKLQPMITSDAGKVLIQTCLNTPDDAGNGLDQRMSAAGFEETEFSYTLTDEEQKNYCML